MVFQSFLSRFPCQKKCDMKWRPPQEACILQKLRPDPKGEFGVLFGLWRGTEDQSSEAFVTCFR